jgi:hypothetical protein
MSGHICFGGVIGYVGKREQHDTVDGKALSRRADVEH